MGPLETRRIPLLFVAATLVPIAALGWLGLRTLDHEGDLERQRRRDSLKVNAARVALDIEQHLQRVRPRWPTAPAFDSSPTVSNLPAISRSCSSLNTTKWVTGMGIRLHPSGTQIAYLTGEDAREVWALENVLPAAK